MKAYIFIRDNKLIDYEPSVIDCKPKVIHPTDAEIEAKASEEYSKEWEPYSWYVAVKLMKWARDLKQKQQ